MSDSSDEDDQGKAESTSRMWAESQPGPSRSQPSGQGYCGYCRVLYSNLDQHLSSLRHLDSVRASSRGSSTVSSTSSSRSKLTLLERFLQDVLQHHPHCYNDPRPSHADLPSVSAPPLPREELDELCLSDDDSRSLGTREHLPSSDAASCQPANQQEDARICSQSGKRVTEGASQERVSTPIREQEEGRTTPSGHTQAPPPVHRKAHRKTNRRKTSESLSSSPPHRGSGPGRRPPSELRPSLSLGLGPGPHPPSELRPSLSLGLGPGPHPPSELRPSLSLGLGPGPHPPSELRPSLSLGLGPGPHPPSELRPWLSWQKERREAHKEEAFSSDHTDPLDPLDQTIEEVIQMCYYGVSSTPCQQEEAESFHFSLPVSMETQSDDWDSPVQVVLQRRQTLSDTQPSRTPVQVSQMEEQDLSCLMDVKVDLEDQVYSYQLESALHSERRAGGGARQDEGFWTLPIEEVLPAPAHIPESFRGKTWAQIEQEDEEKVEKLVRQFRRERFICYFDTESLARYGRTNQNKKGRDDKKGAEPDTGVLPLLDCDEHDSAYVRRRRRKRRAFRVASRCQVVKVSHSTQTVRLVVPAVRKPASEAPPTSVPSANQDVAERTPDVQTWRCLPPSYSNIITPLQPRTSVVYLLCSPAGPAPTYTPAQGSTPKRCRKKRRPLDLQGVKVKYKRLPVRFYDPSRNRILKNPPKGLLWHRGSTPSSPPPPCVRQLFRSLSPDLNTDRPPGEGAAGSSRVKGQRSSDTVFSHGNSFLLSTLSRDSAQTDKRDTVRRRGRTSQAPPPHSTSERGRGGRRERTQRTQPPPSKRRTRAHAMPPQPRRESMRRAGPSRKVPGSTGPPHPPSPRQGSARRGRGCKRGRR
ncbi:DBF4-type zinc finger-containing protein 2 isoform X2 [Siniperca chuatsi]|uniref:DBF4-type zinc finger-containing protein 2 isoform X2 n=1 Tax=Siniperca chuatsi TaxID=119488 RepID=UPI001CE0C7B1|nr:DBF4-type zinc finger-containing protein 2 isoform X2 [Siniperca chuatsi]